MLYLYINISNFNKIMQRININSIIQRVLTEGSAKGSNFITPDEFQFMYDVASPGGKYYGFVPTQYKANITKKIKKYLNTSTINYGEYVDCVKAKKKLLNLEDNPNISDDALISNKIKAKFENDVQYYCSVVPKFMNENIQLIFNNARAVENKDEDFNVFIKTHIDVFLDFFEGRMNNLPKDPKDDINRDLVTYYDSKYSEQGKLIDIEKATPNYTYDIYKNNLDTPGNNAYNYVCSDLNEGIRKLLCTLTKQRKTKDSFKFEKFFEHSRQFVTYKGGIVYELQSFNDAVALAGLSDKNLEISTKKTITNEYIKILTITLANIDVKEIYSNDLDLGSTNTVRELLETLITENRISLEENANSVKADVKVAKPVYECGTRRKILDAPDFIELKYFTLKYIGKHHNTLHITRILEPDVNEIFKGVKKIAFINENYPDIKKLQNFVAEIIEVIIDITKDLIETKDFDKIKNISRKMRGIIIDGPKFIPQDDDSWEYSISKGGDKQRGVGVSINVKLPDNLKVYDIKYNSEKNNFCLVQE